METELLKRWRLALGDICDGEKCDGTDCTLSDDEQIIDNALSTVYNADKNANLAKSAPSVRRWLGNVKRVFPENVVQIIQRDAIDRLGLKKLLAEKSFLENVVPDVNLAAILLSLGKIIPSENKAAVRNIIKKVADDLYNQLYFKMQQSISGTINRAERHRNPRFKDIDWHSTIKKNLKNYQPKYKTIIPETLIGYGKKRKSFNDVFLCIDQSGSMADSMIYSAVYGSVMAQMPSLNTRFFVFDTKIVDLSENLNDVADLLCGVQLGGGTDIGNALAYCNSVVQRPEKTIFVLVSDLYEGGDSSLMFNVAIKMLERKIKIIVLLALTHDGAGSYNRANAQKFSSLNIPVFACSPDKFAEIMATAINGKELE